MPIKKTRWSKVYESSEEELIAVLHSRGVQTERFHVEELVALPPQTAQAGQTVWCAEGSATITTADGKLSLQPGDAIRFDTPTNYDVQAGITGFAYYLSS
ncbi:MAG: hypothetical protein JWN38_492 [Candidatus Saccharibacteria bacterium]|nr:hypothetical protein [Candidatus Saccharibacteria bacterium]